MNEILIIGCGISGMLTALGLAKYGIKSTIIERKSLNSLQTPDDPRTTALNDSSISYMNSLNIWHDLESYSQEIKDIFVCQNMSNDVFHIKGDEEELGRMIKNTDLRRILFEITKKNELISLVAGTSYDIKEITNDYVEIGLISNDEIISKKYKLCIAADGRFSEAKSKFFQNRTCRDYKQKAIVFNISHNLPHEGGAIEHFLERGSFATLPLKDQFESSIVWVEETKIAEFFVKEPYEKIEKYIEKFIGGSLGNIKIISKPESFPLSAFICEKYYKGRLALIADSAHSMHPLAGQGLNMGIKDIAKLVELISERWALGLDLDGVLLSEYEKARKKDNINMVRVTDIINKFTTSKFKFLHKFSERSLSIIGSIPNINKILVNYAKGNR